MHIQSTFRFIRMQFSQVLALFVLFRMRSALIVQTIYAVITISKWQIRYNYLIDRSMDVGDLRVVQ